MSTLLSVRDLHVRYPLSQGLDSVLGGKPSFVDVVHGVSLDINSGETTAIVGESGSGKTTLAMALCGLAPVVGGEVCFEGRVLQADRRNMLNPDRKRFALMFQDPVGSLNPRMTIRKALAEPFRIHKPETQHPDREALRLLSLVGLGEDFADRYPHQLSGGQARRVGVARAIALEPDILIADEPTAGLDVSIQGEILNLLSRLQEEMGLGILMITHNLNIVRHIADQMAIMYLGRFVEQGESQTIFSQPRHPYTAALLSANPSPDPDAQSQIIELLGDVPSLLQRPSGCEFHTRCPRTEARCENIFPELTSGSDKQVFNCHFPMEFE
jgi:oligopeptide/dipeptide ABC transporter ATP-binding protein